jgi:hypothetical protein
LSEDLQKNLEEQQLKVNNEIKSDVKINADSYIKKHRVVDQDDFIDDFQFTELIVSKSKWCMENLNLTKFSHLEILQIKDQDDQRTSKRYRVINYPHIEKSDMVFEDNANGRKTSITIDFAPALVSDEMINACKRAYNTKIIAGDAIVKARDELAATVLRIITSHSDFTYTREQQYSIMRYLFDEMAGDVMMVNYAKGWTTTAIATTGMHGDLTNSGQNKTDFIYTLGAKGLWRYLSRNTYEEVDIQTHNLKQKTICDICYTTTHNFRELLKQIPAFLTSIAVCVGGIFAFKKILL